MLALDGVGNLPLGLFPDQEYEQATLQLRPGDQIVFYTDGITEALNADGRDVRPRAARRGAGELPPRRARADRDGAGHARRSSPAASPPATTRPSSWPRCM